MIHREAYRVRWHDTNAARTVHPTGVLTYMQETANCQFECNGLPLDALRDEQGVGFILSRVALEFHQPIHAYEQIEVETFTCPPHGCAFPRGFRVRRGDVTVAEGMSVWALLRLADRTLLRAADAPMAFGDEQPLSLSVPLRVAVPRDAVFETVGTRTVQYSDVDYNMHMNNTKYPNMVCDFLPDVGKLCIVGMSLSFCHEAALGDTLTVYRAAGTAAGEYFVRVCHGDTLCTEALVRTKPGGV